MIIIKILFFEKIKTCNINKISQTQNDKTFDENINSIIAINKNTKREL